VLQIEYIRLQAPTLLDRKYKRTRLGPMHIESASIIWAIIAIVFGIAEVVLPSFGCIFVTGAAGLVAIVALFPIVGVQIQMTVFAVAVITGLVFLRPKLLSKMQKSQGVVSRTDALIGKLGVITAPVDPVAGFGRAAIEGHDWAAKSETHLDVNTKVVVLSADGIVLNVKKVK